MTQPLNLDRYSRRGAFLTVLLVAGLTMTACGSDEPPGPPSPQPTGVPEPTASPEPTPGPEPTVQPGPDCEIVEGAGEVGAAATETRCRCRNPDANPDICDFDVKLVFSDDVAVEPVSYSYSLDAVPWVRKDQWESNNNDRFEYLQTAQFRVQSGTPKALWLSDTTGRANCVAVFNQSRDPVNLKLGGNVQDSSRQYILEAAQISELLSNTAPIQLTLIPFSDPSGNCQTPPSAMEAGRAVAVWISTDSFPGPFDCDIKQSVGADGYSDGANCDLRAYWQFVPAAGGEPAYVEHRGSLYDMVGKALPNNELWINIEEGVTVNMGLSTGFVRMPVRSGFEGACQNVVNSINSNGFDATTNKGSCQFSDRAEAYTRYTDKKIVVTGFGRINGWDVLQRYGGSKSENPDQQWDYARWEIAVQLLNLSSAYPATAASDPSIDVSHITVAFPAKRGVGAVTLNSATTPFPGDWDGNNYPVKMFDFKQAGGWIDQADGPEVMGEKSLIEFSYIHSNDDAVKLSANGVNYKYSTLLHGDAGGAVNLGSYGKNRTVMDSVIEGLYIHRITNKKIEGQNGQPSWLGTRGVITSRTCPEKALVDNPGGATRLMGIRIHDVYIPSLGSPEGPNSISALFSLGVKAKPSFNGDTFFCDEGRYVDTLDFGDFTFSGFRVYTNPLNKSFLYNDLDKNKRVRVNWHPIRFCPSSNGTTCDRNGSDWTDAVKIFPASQNQQFYYVCGQEGAAVDGCWNSAGENGVDTELGGTSNNVQYYDEGNDVFQNNVVFPYGN